SKKDLSFLLAKGPASIEFNTSKTDLRVIVFTEEADTGKPICPERLKGLEKGERKGGAESLLKYDTEKKA
ncbi:MAG: hypothetical protein ACKO96_24925, partial [Flammeovirgaceae bacterium]